MKKSLRKEYPKEWEKMARTCKELAEWKCQKCGIAHRTPRLTFKGDLKPVFLVAAHKHHDRHNINAILICVCPSCHWKYFRQFGHKPAWIIARLRRQGKMK